jgi:peptide/nickel transport system permease protein
MNKALKGFMKAPFTSQLGMVVVMVYAFVALTAPLLAPFGETEIVGDQYEPWGSVFLLGTDNIGRDMLTRLIYGARNTVGIAFVITSLAFVIGGFTGMLAATLGGWIDQILSRIVDVLMAIPGLVFVLLVLSFFGTAIPVLIIVIAIFESTRVFRLTRAVAMNVEVMDYVEISKLRGESMWWIVWSEILPNTTAPLVAEFGVRFTYTFLFITALSFLGLGIQPPIADWGGMVRENAVLITFSDFTPLLPATAIALLTVSVNFVIDWVLQKASGLKE